MLDQISNRKIDLNSLGRIINSLKGLLGVLTERDQDWIKRFEHEWGVLEQVYALNLYHSTIVLNQEDLEAVSEALQHMKVLVEMKLEQRS